MVRAIRRKRSRHKRRSPKWWDERPLGLYADKVLAKRFGCSKKLVQEQRELQGIATYALVKQDTRMLNEKTPHTPPVDKRAAVLSKCRAVKESTDQRAINAGIGVRSDVDVARDLSLTRERVRQIRVRLGMPRPPAKVPKMQLMWELWHKGTPIPEIAEEFHTRAINVRAYVLLWAKKHSLPYPGRPKTHPNCRMVTKSARGYILRSRGLTWGQVAVAVGKPANAGQSIYAMVRQLAKRRSWPWPPKREPKKREDKLWVKSKP